MAIPLPFVIGRLNASTRCRFLCRSIVAAVLLIDRKRGKPRHLVNVDAIKQLLEAYNVPYTHLTDFRGTFEEQVSNFGPTMIQLLSILAQLQTTCVGPIVHTALTALP